MPYTLRRPRDAAVLHRHDELAPVLEALQMERLAYAVHPDPAHHRLHLVITDDAHPAGRIIVDALSCPEPTPHAAGDTSNRE